MTESEFIRDCRDFFTRHQVGIQLRERWENRVNQYREQLIDEADEAQVRRLQAALQYHRDVLIELGL